MILFDMIGDFLRPLLNCLPHVAERGPSNEWMIIDPWWGEPYVLKRNRPKLYVPSFTKVEYWPKTEEPVNTGPQSPTTSDNVSITIDTGFSYIITDPLKVRARFGNNYIERISMQLRAEITKVVREHTFTYGKSCVQAVEGTIREIWAEYGIELTLLSIEDYAMSSNIRHFGTGIAIHATTTTTGAEA